MTETEKATKNATPYQSDPTKVSINTSWLDCAAAVSSAKNGGPAASEDCKTKPGNVIHYEAGGRINPEADWQKSFIGRGPIQATHRHFYVQALAVLEKRAEELAVEAPESQDLKGLREAIDKTLDKVAQ